MNGLITPGRFAGKVVVVTGAAQGIGEAVARRVGAEGGVTFLADRSELVHDVSADLVGEGAKPRSASTTADLETWEGAEHVIDQALATFKRVDVLINNVGGTIWAKPFQFYEPDQIVAEINRSLFPTMWMCRAVVPTMIKKKRGTILNVSSIATKGLNRAPYGAAKGGVKALTACLAMELGPYGIRVASVAPGATQAPPRKVSRGGEPRTAREKRWYQTIFDQSIDSSLLKRMGTLDEQAAAITFMASDEASYITGSTLPVGGGDQG
ncbi:MAG: 1,6-dihydroxycyclohexa-2,4-diene-1-carboxylate dehydrogenase [Actinomycetales bacterium]